MQGTLTTFLSLVSITGTEVAKADASFLKVWYIYLQSVSFSGNCSKLVLLGVRFFLPSIVLSPVTGESFFFLSHSRLFFLQLGLVGSLERGRAGILPLVDFAFLGLDSLVWDSLVVVP